jgi:WD repeat-containing protein 23
VFGAQFNHAGDSLMVVTQDQHIRFYSLEEEMQRGLSSAARDDGAEGEPDIQRIFDCSQDNEPTHDASSLLSSLPSVSDRTSFSSTSGTSTFTASPSSSLGSCSPSSGWPCTLDLVGRQVGWSIVSTDFSPDDRLLAYSTWSPLVHLLPTPKGDGGMQAMQNSAELGVASSARGCSRSQNQQSLNFEPQCKRFCVFSLAFSPCGSLLLGGASDRCLYLYDLNSCGRRAAAVLAHADDVNAVAWADANVLLTAGDDRVIKLWDRRMIGQRGSGMAPAASSNSSLSSYPPSSSTSPSAGGGCGVSALSSSSSAAPPPPPCTRSTPVGVFLGHSQGIASLCARGDGRHVLSNSKDQTAKIWDLRNMSAACDAEAAARSATADACFDYRWPATHANKVACARALLAAATGTPITPSAPPARPCPISSAVNACLMALSGASFSPAATSATSNSDLRHQATTATSVASSPNAAPLIAASASIASGSASSDHQSRVNPYDRSVLTLRGHRVLETLVRAYFSPLHSTGQRFVYSGSQCGSVLVWDTMTGELVKQLRGHHATVRDVAWHPYKPATLVSASWDCSIAKWQ